MVNQLFMSSLEKFIEIYDKGIYRPRTESDVQGYLFALCIEEFIKNNIEQDLHLNCPNKNLDPSSRKKIDIVLNNEVAVEIKFEADFPGVSKPVVFSNEAVKDITRLSEMKENGMPFCHFLFIDEDGTHFRNFYKYVDIPINWNTVRINGKTSHILHIIL